MCVWNISEGSSSSLSDLNSLDMVQCTDHMCPVRVHWHVKNNYMSHWRVKITVSNYNYKRNYSNWNVLVQHPGFSEKVITYSFNSTTLPTFGFTGTHSISSYCLGFAVVISISIIIFQGLDNNTVASVVNLLS